MSTPTLPNLFCGSPARTSIAFYGDQNRFSLRLQQHPMPRQLDIPTRGGTDAAAAWHTRTYWQPIATAPKTTARWIDLWSQSRQRTTRCYWGRPQHLWRKRRLLVIPAPITTAGMARISPLATHQRRAVPLMPMPAAPTASHSVPLPSQSLPSFFPSAMHLETLQHLRSASPTARRPRAHRQAPALDLLDSYEGKHPIQTRIHGPRPVALQAHDHGRQW